MHRRIYIKLDGETPAARSLAIAAARRLLTRRSCGANAANLIDLLEHRISQVGVFNHLFSFVMGTAIITGGKARKDNTCAVRQDGSPDRMPSRDKRRFSVDSATRVAVENIHTTMEKLHDLWDEVSMDAETREARVRTAYTHLDNLLKEMIECETEMVKNMRSAAVELRLKASSLIEELDADPLRIPLSCPEGSIGLFKYLEELVEKLSAEKESRLEAQLKLSQELSFLTVRLHVDVPDIHETDQKCLSAHEFELLRERVSELQKTLNERMAKCQEIQEDIRAKLSQVGGDVTCDGVAEFLSDGELLDFSDSRMYHIQNMHEAVLFKFEEWAVAADKEYTQTYWKLKDLWDRCFIPEEERKFPPEFSCECNSAADLHALRKEYNDYEQLYQERSTVFGKVNEWRDLWTENVEFTERSAKDKNFYNNRGGNLNQILKRNNEVKKLLSKAERDVEEAMKEYNNNHSQPIMIDGLTPKEYISREQIKYEEEKLSRRNSVKAAPKRTGPQSPFVGASTPKRGRLPKKDESSGSLGLSIISPISTRPIFYTLARAQDLQSDPGEEAVNLFTCTRK
ncbi:hypothetical protein L596_014983 [Steinernema carpocapsae]|uniref:Protein regulator of cytokinesis 1 n=1 Tax=Steinernema carpocapsae TaxID=34508 RepID=A0A4U5NEH5_STECR|nr:hypothetical protein L596_014983 [Steinernema carpocapsae]